MGPDMGRLLFVQNAHRLCVLEWRNSYVLTRGLFWCLFPELHSNEGIKHQNNTRVCAYTFRKESTSIISFLTRRNESITDDKSDDPHTSTRGSLARFTFCYSRHNDQTIELWRDHVDNDL